MKSIILIILVMGIFISCGSDSDNGAAGSTPAIQLEKPQVD